MMGSECPIPPSLVFTHPVLCSKGSADPRTLSAAKSRFSQQINELQQSVHTKALEIRRSVDPPVLAARDWSAADLQPISHHRSR